jgi:uncharacterized protein (TIGR02271 family)
MGNSKKTLELREEQLEISKKPVVLSEVDIRKETITEEKTITVPVTREEVIIESKNSDGTVDLIKIPTMEEHVEITKHPVALEDVSYHIEETQENKHITETLKKEKLDVKTVGFATVIDKEIKDPPDFS